jgi:hypothetical protein
MRSVSPVPQWCGRSNLLKPLEYAASRRAVGSSDLERAAVPNSMRHVLDAEGGRGCWARAQNIYRLLLL